MSGQRFLLAMIDGGGTVPPSIGLAGELVRRGHRVRVRADPTVQLAARAAGCSFTPWRRAPHFASVAEQTAVISRMEEGNPYQQFKTVRNWLLGRTPIGGYAADVVAAVTAHPVDALLVEAAVPGILIGAHGTGLPTAALMANIYLRPTVGQPLVGTGWSPAQGRLGRLRDRLAPRAVDKMTGLLVPAMNDHLWVYGQPLVTNLFQLLDRCTRVLVMTSPSFDFTPSQLPANVSYVGPQLEDPHWATATDQSWRPDGDGPLVMVSLSSIHQNQLPVLRRIVAGLRRLPIRATVTTGQAIDPNGIEAPSNVRIVGSAPHNRVLAEAAAVITHAGHGTVLKTLAAGVPLLCIPMGRDQRDNTTRVLRLGAGLRLSNRNRPDRIAVTAQNLLEDPSYTDAARRFAAILAHEATSRPSAADEAESLLAHAQP